MATPDVEMLVIGAGPAGMAAAAEAAHHGVKVTVVDENPLPGGQIYKQLPEEFAIRDERTVAAYQIEGGKRIDRLKALPVEILTDTVAWGIFGDEVALAGPSGSRTVKPRQLVLATGAYERVVPFPGWTLPGIFTAGGAQTLMKHQRIRPGQRVLLSGTGPLQLVVANQLIEAGARVVGVLEAARADNWWTRLPNVWREIKLISEGVQHVWNLKRAGVPLLTGHSIVAAKGADQVESAVIAQLDHQWRPIPGTEREMEVDAICVGYGFVPSVECAVGRGCGLEYLHEVGGWVAKRNEWMETTVPGVYAVGDGAGVAGVLVATEEGRLAGLSAAIQLGQLTERDCRKEADQIRRRLTELAKFRKALDEQFAFQPGILDLMQPDTVVCRCEEISCGEISEALDQGARVANHVKQISRCGMGLCQGKMCGPVVAAMTARRWNIGVDQAGFFSPRPPYRPITVNDLKAWPQELYLQAYQKDPSLS